MKVFYPATTILNFIWFRLLCVIYFNLLIFHAGNYGIKVKKSIILTIFILCIRCYPLAELF